MIIADLAATVLVFATGVVLLVLTVLSVPAWWTTKFEFPPPTLNTLALASGAGIAFFISCRLRRTYGFERS